MVSRSLWVSVGAAVVIGSGLYCLYYFSSRKKVSSPSSSSDNITVSQLWIYPIKSCSGVSLKSVTFGTYGFEFDRTWVVVRGPHPKGYQEQIPTTASLSLLTQRENQKMKMLTASIDRSSAGIPTLVITSAAHGANIHRRIEVEVLAEEELQAPGQALLQIEKWELVGGFIAEGKDVADWLSDFLGESVFLARCVQPRNPNENTKYAHLMRPTDRVLGHDFSPLHLISEEGLSWIQQQTGDDALKAERFRPNIVVSGTQFPEEDTWLDFSVGGSDVKEEREEGECPPPPPPLAPTVQLRSCTLCSRCSIPTIDESGKLHRLYQPTATMRELRSKPCVPDDPQSQVKPMFGINVFHDLPEEGDGQRVRISLGDQVRVTSLRNA